MRQSFAWWSFTFGRDVDGPAFLRDAAAAGAEGVEMLPRDLHAAARDAGLALVTVAMPDLTVGFNDPNRHAALRDDARRLIDDAAGDGVEQVIVFAGNCGALDDDAALDACAVGVAPVADHARGAGVGLLFELLNSKVDHPGFQCDSSAFGFEVVRRVASPSFRVLFDAYHMQLMEGDLSRTIKANVELIGHVHTAGVPGRRDLGDRRDEVSWPAIAGVLRHAGYDGWVGHELVPRADPIDALRRAIDLFR